MFGARSNALVNFRQVRQSAGGQSGGELTRLRTKLAVRQLRPEAAHEFISAMPNGYDTDVRRRGVRLSSGQRQLVAFARAFLADPRVLILDEATSSLDLPSERLVQRALRTLLRGRTAVIIAHRLNTIDNVDQIFFVNSGEITLAGSMEHAVDLLLHEKRES